MAAVVGEDAEELDPIVLLRAVLVPFALVPGALVLVGGPNDSNDMTLASAVTESSIRLSRLKRAKLARGANASMESDTRGASRRGGAGYDKRASEEEPMDVNGGEDGGEDGGGGIGDNG